MNMRYQDGLVSVIVPVYNAEKYIDKTIQSVLAQTYTNYEIVLVNDCSKDQSLQKIEEYAQNNASIKVFTLKKNSGAAVARNYGLDMAQGRYIAFLDSDDTWAEDKLEKQLAFMKENDAAFVYCSYDMVDADGNLIKKPIKIKKRTRYKDLLTKTMISTPTVLIDRYKTGSILMPLRRTGQDYAFWLQLLRRYDAYGMEEAYAHVCRRNDSLSKNKFQNIRDVWEVQTINEKINKFIAFFHIMGYGFYAIKKRFF